MSVSAQTNFVSPIQELQTEVRLPFRDHSLGHSRGLGVSPVLDGFLTHGGGHSSLIPVIQSESDNERLQSWLGGGGAVLDGRRCSGTWTHQESSYRVNILQTLAVLRALQYCQESLRPGILLVQTDNKTILSDLKRMGRAI